MEGAFALDQLEEGLGVGDARLDLALVADDAGIASSLASLAGV